MEHKFIEEVKYEHLKKVLMDYDDFKFKSMLSDLIKDTDINILKKKFKMTKVKKETTTKPTYSIFDYPKESDVIHKLYMKFPKDPVKAAVALAVNFPDTWKEAFANHLVCTIIARAEKELKNLTEKDKEIAKNMMSFFEVDNIGGRK